MIDLILRKIGAFTGEYFWINRLKRNQTLYRKASVGSFERKARVLLHNY